MSFQIVLTASITPNGPHVRLNDAQVRRQQYLQSLTTLLRTDDPIIRGITLIENTGADLEDFQRLADRENGSDKKIELISLRLNDFPIEFGIGYGEFLLLDEGLRRSELMQPGVRFAKLTGRLRVRNLVAILRDVPETVDLAADIAPFKDASLGFIDTRLMVVSWDYYRTQIIGMYRQVNGSKNVTAEACLYQVVRNSPGADILPSLPWEPRWAGYSGSTGMQYDSLWMRLRYPARVARRTAKQIFNQPNLRKVWQSSQLVA